MALNKMLKFIFYCIWTFTSGSLHLYSNLYVNAKYILSNKANFKKEYLDNKQSQAYAFFYTSVPSESVDRKDFSNVKVNSGSKEDFRFSIHESQVLTSSNCFNLENYSFIVFM